VLRAARLLAEHTGIAAGATLRLEKHLPVSAGIGGGSSDAAAALLALRELWRLSVSNEALRELGAGLGADVPACLYGRAVWVGGIGERLEPAGRLPAAGLLLANPRRPLPTAAVFAARRGPFGSAARFARMPSDAAGLADELARRRNDLTEAAMGLVPEIGAVLARLLGLPGALLARMSGSGATCFALFEGRAAAEAARAALTAGEPSWWCAAGGFLAGGGLCD
jgi:4-diphosphocytidyl-2-C-methyl-D-erythritol kinase